MTAKSTTEEETTPEQPVWDDGGLTLTGLNALREPTPAEEIKQRPAPGGSGKMLDYVDARFVMDRLDVCAGPQNWQTQYEDVHGGGVRCSLSIKVMGTWVSKTDVGDASTIEPIKGAHSDALKRAAVQWGIARDLYDARDEQYVQRPQPSPAQMQSRQTMGAQPTQQQRAAAPMVATSSPPMSALNPTGWVCPIHGGAKITPAGTSKTTGKPYAAFVSCAVQGPPFCNEKPPRVVAVAAPAAVVYEEEPLPFNDEEQWN
jgi:hypothetical protein